MSVATDVVNRYLAALGGDDPDLVASLVAEDFRNEHVSALGEQSDGREQYRRRLPRFMAEFADRRYSVERTVEARAPGPPAGRAVDVGDTVEVVVRYRFHAVHDGHRIEVPGVMWFTVAGERITTRVDVWDSLTFLRQTGASPG